MTKKELKKLARNKINQGKTRQEALNELKEETQATLTEIATALKNIPPKQTREKYRILNIILLCVLGLTIITKVMSGIPIVLENGIKWFPILFLVPLINIVLAYGVAKYDGAIYRWVGILPILTLLRSMPTYLNGPMDFYKIIDLVVFGLLIFLGFFLKNKFSSDYETKREYYINDSGENRGRDIVYFND